MKKFIFILLTILITPMLCFFVSQQQNFYCSITPIDSGFDSDYGDYDNDDSWGGGYGGGSYWDDDDDYNNNHNSSNKNSGSSSYYSGEPLSPEGVAYLLAILFIMIVPAIIIICVKSGSRPKQTYTRKTIYHNPLTVEEQINNTLLNRYGLRRGDGSNLKLIQNAYQNYVEIQKAWMNRDLTPIKHLLTDEMYNMYQMQVETLIEDNQINVMSDFEFVSGGLVSVKNINNLETLKIVLFINYPPL